MKRTEEVPIVLNIVCQLLRTRLDWVSQGQVLHGGDLGEGREGFQ